MQNNVEWFLSKLTKTQDKVIQLLTWYPQLRDNDPLLVATFQKYEIGANKFEKLSAREFLTLMIDGKITTYDTITRARRKIQEEYPQLRGENYIERQKNSVEVRNKINN